MYEGQLAQTGPLLVVGGLAISESWLLAAGLGLVVAGALLVRLTYRRGRTPAQ